MNSHIPDTRHLVLYFQVHQPNRLNKFNFFSIGSHPEYVNHSLNEELVNRIAKDCYLPANTLLLKLITDHPEVKVCFSISGTALAQFEQYTPEVIQSFKALADTGNVEFLAETNYHSLASLISEEEFHTQVVQHQEKMQQLLGVRPSVFRNTELIYSDAIGEQIAKLGFTGIITDGVQRVLKNKNTHASYQHPAQNLRILLRANSLSDDIAFRYSSGRSRLTAKQYVHWLNQLPQTDKVVVLGMDYETFGEHHKKESGILEFLQKMITTLVGENHFAMSTPSEVIALTKPSGELSVPEAISWADERKDLSAWLGNDMQQDAFQMIKSLETSVKQLSDSHILEIWRSLQTSDHFYYMCTKRLNDGDVHSYFSHYPSPYEAFINYMNTMNDFVIMVKHAQHTSLTEANKKAEYERQHSEVPVWAQVNHSTYSQEVFVSHS